MLPFARVSFVIIQYNFIKLYLSRTFSLSTQLSPTFRKLRDLVDYCGVCSRVARELLATPQHVRYVALGLSTSERVNEATHCQDPGANRVSLSLREWSRISEV